MTEDFEENSAEGLDLNKYLGIARRRHWQFLVPLFFGWALVFAASWALPSTYKSATTILIEQPTVSKELVPSNVNDNLQGRLQSITQQILSRTRLLHIIQTLDLYVDKQGRSAPDDSVERMRKDIGIELVRSPGTDQLTSFNVSFSSHDPRVAQQVTSELTNLFISENLEVQTTQAQDTTKFFEAQLEEARSNLAAQEEKIREFKGQHVSDLPGQLQSNLAILTGLQSQRQAEEDNLDRAKQQSVYYQSLLNQYRSLQSSPKSTGGAPVGLPAVDQELDKLRGQLADLTARGYTDRHPDVRKVKDQIAQTVQMRQQILVDLKSSTQAEATLGAPVPPDPDSQDTAAMAELKSQLQANKIEVANRERSIAALNAKIGEYQGHLGQEPMREQQLADLSRGYEQSKANYDDLLKKKNASALSTSLTERQQGEHFRVLDPPSLPIKPDFPNHLKLSGVGLGVGLFLGVALAGATEFLDDRIHSEKELRGLVPVDVLSEIPGVATVEERQTEHRSIWLAWIAATIVFVSILAGTAFSYLRG
jgi:succinoglycan biosynthesis transport protein ExoP